MTCQTAAPTQNQRSLGQPSYGTITAKLCQSLQTRSNASGASLTEPKEAGRKKNCSVISGATFRPTCRGNARDLSCSIYAPGVGFIPFWVSAFQRILAERAMPSASPWRAIYADFCRPSGRSRTMRYLIVARSASGCQTRSDHGIRVDRARRRLLASA